MEILIRFGSLAYSSRLLTITHRAYPLTRDENYGLREKKEKKNPMPEALSH
jgi:hypothetical protein